MENRRPCQQEFISKYVDQNREQFTEELFTRNEDNIIEEVKKVILSCQRFKHFTIKVLGFDVVEDYNQIQQILQQYEEKNSNSRNKTSKPKGKKKFNQYDYINLRDSDVKLLMIHYYLQGKGDKGQEAEEYIDVPLAIPRIVNRYYFRISGNLYSAMFQITDGSTYNSMTSTNAKTPSITFKTYMPPIKIYKYTIKLLEDTSQEELLCNLYQSITFTKKFPAILFILAKMGYYQGMSFLGNTQINITENPIADGTLYHFKEKDMYVSVPKIYFNNDPMIQSIVASLLKYIPLTKHYTDIFKQEFWLKCLGKEYNKAEVEKGDNMLDSLESIYPLSSKEELRLPEEQKATVYHLLRWMMREFINLKQKSNLNIGYKKIRIAEYIASLYSMKICNSIYRISSKGSSVKIYKLRQAIKIHPMYLLRSISKYKLVNYRDLVNDLDAILALQFSYKGVSGIGQNNKDTVPEIYKFVHPSQLGRLDTDSSHKSDPGMSGNLCPLVKLDNKYFSHYKEPNEWEDNFDEIVDNYKKATGIRDLFKFKKEVLNIETSLEEQSLVNDNIDSMKSMLPPLFKHLDDENNNSNIGIPLEESGSIMYNA